jgi:hypothetical protein
MRTVRTALGNLALAVLGTVVAMLLLEGVLQVGALYTRATRLSGPRTWLRSGQRVVALGDSNTYGFFLDSPAAEAYPMQFQTLWNARAPQRQIEVLNLGVPGMNSSKLRTALPDLIRTLRPQIVTIMVGVNDFWIAPADESDDGRGLFDTLWRRSRVFRFFYMLRRALQGNDAPAAPNVQPTLTFPKLGDDKPPEVTLHYGDQHLDLTPPAISHKSKSWPEGLQRNLVAMTALAEQAGVRLILLTYPSEGALYMNANTAARRAAAEGGALLIDLGSEFLKLCPSKKCDDLFYFDNHPKLKGHQLAAQMMVDRLLGTLPTAP